jgi:hypothetical protein
VFAHVINELLHSIAVRVDRRLTRRRQHQRYRTP